MRPGPGTVAAVALALLATGGSVQPASASDAAAPVVTDHGGPTLAQLVGYEDHVLAPGSPLQAGLLPAYADRVAADAAAGVTPDDATTPGAYPGETVIAGRRGVVFALDARGWALRYADASGAELPRAQWIPTRTDTIYDLASLSKLFTSLVAVQQLEKGRLHLDATVASYLPSFARNGKAAITIRELLTHTSGLRPDPIPELWTYATHRERVHAILAESPESAPGTAYVYSDLNMMSLQLVLETVTGRTLDRLVRDDITRPLHMDDTMYTPPVSLRPRIAAEEYQTSPDRGLVWGEVHDENAWALGGVAGHAGVFSTAHDLAILAQTMLNGGTYGGARILSQQWTVAMLTECNRAFPGNEHGLGWELWQHYESGALATPMTAAHTGFTGTSITVDPTTQSFVILLTNRVHPSRSGPSVNPHRRAVADDIARGVAVPPVAGATAWYSGMTDAGTATLTLPVTLPPGRKTLHWATYWDTAPRSDVVTLEASTDAGATWTAVPWTARGAGIDVRTPGGVAGYEGHQWMEAHADLTRFRGAVQVRWRYTTDAEYHGRGVYVDAVRIERGPGTVLIDTEGRPDAFTAVGWTASAD